MKLISFTFIFVLLIAGCGGSESSNENYSDETSLDPFEAALPHSEALPTKNMSDDDKIKLAQANGKIAQTLSLDSFSYLIKNDTSGLLICNFWTIDCQPCIQNIELLKDLQQNSLEGFPFNVVHINIDALYPDMINSFIREKGLINPVYSVNVDSVQNWPSLIQIGWDGQLPAMLIVNNDDGTNLFYQNTFSKEEFQAVLLPLTF